jgi:hypothetical protein
MAETTPYAVRLTKPTGSVADITRIRRVHIPRFREQQPAIGQDLQDTVPGSGSGDQ